MFDINNFIIDRVLRGVAFKTNTWDMIWSVNQLTDVTLSCSSEETTATDALGTTIMTFERAKTAQLTATNALFDLGLLAHTFGTEKEIASATNKITTPKFEVVSIVDGQTEYTLSQTPKEDIEHIYVLNGDDTVGTAYNAGTAASDTEFVYSSGKITVPTSAKVGQEFIVMYEYDAEQAVSVTNSATKFPTAFKFVLEVLGADVCDPSTLIYAYIIFPAAKLSSTVDITLATDGGVPITINCYQEYCDREKKLFQIIVVDESEDANVTPAPTPTPNP